MDEKITLCLTAGGRPDLLRRTLASLLAYNGQFFSDIIISNDRGDEETSAVARELCPSATIFSHNPPFGQMRSIDQMYAAVKTPLIFHCEDDWFFDPVTFIPGTVAMLELAGPKTSAVAVRQSGCQGRYSGAVEHRVRHPNGSISATLYDDAHQDAFTFNPTLLRRSFWESVGPYAKHKHEGTISTLAIKGGYELAFLVPGVCYHIGEGRHIVDEARERASLPRRAWRSLRRRTMAFLTTK